MKNTPQNTPAIDLSLIEKTIRNLESAYEEIAELSTSGDAWDVVHFRKVQEALESLRELKSCHEACGHIGIEPTCNSERCVNDAWRHISPRRKFIEKMVNEDMGIYKEDSDGGYKELEGGLPF